MDKKRFNFEVSAIWQNDKTVEVESPILTATITTVIPPPFKDGVSGFWSAEHLFLASIASCFVHTFQHLAALSELPFESISCNISGDVEMIDHVFAFHKVQLFPTLAIPLEAYRKKAESVLEKTENNCLIANSLKTAVSIETKILVNELIGEFQY
jgi:organic hydroperoxide reductase OsmC/OhrA